MPSGQNFPRISIGKERFTAIDAEGEETLLGLDSFECLVVASNPAISKVHFAAAYTGDEGTPPDCFSDNGYYPDVRASNPQCESCALCHHNRWGSAKSNLTGADLKACQDFKKLAVVPLHDTVEGVHQFRVSPAALKNWSRYCNELRKIGGDCGFDVTPDLVVTKVFWSDKKNIMDFEFIDFLDEELGEFVTGVKDDNEFESWIGLDNQAQSYPVIASEPREKQQRLAAPAKRPEPEPVEAEVVEEKPARSATARRGIAKPAPKADEPVAGRARKEAEALGATQGERRLSPVEIAKARARQQMGRPAV